MASTSLHESMHGQGVVNYIAGMLTRMADGLWCMRMVKEWPRRARKCARRGSPSSHSRGHGVAVEFKIAKQRKHVQTWFESRLQGIAVKYLW